jgi:hypothetical protein
MRLLQSSFGRFGLLTDHIADATQATPSLVCVQKDWLARKLTVGDGEPAFGRTDGLSGRKRAGLDGTPCPAGKSREAARIARVVGRAKVAYGARGPIRARLRKDPWLRGKNRRCC